MRSIETEGACRCFALEAFGAQVRQTLAILETEDEAAEAGPAGFGRLASGVGEVGLEAAGLGADPGEFTGAEIDQEVELGVGVGCGGGDEGAVIGVFRHRGEGFIVRKERKA
jgi:hypothetical protein